MLSWLDRTQQDSEVLYSALGIVAERLVGLVSGLLPRL